MKTCDVIVIGAGHNGLVTAAYLARAGKSVLVLERREKIGGICVSEELAPSLSVEPVVSGGMLRPEIMRDLGLARFGLSGGASNPGLVSVLPGGRRLAVTPSAADTAASVLPFSQKDAARWPEFAAFMERAAGFLDAAYRTPMPRLPEPSAGEALPLAKLGLKLRGLGAKEMYAVIRMLPMTAREFLDEWFESDELKAALASLGIHNANLGVMSAGSAFNLLHQYLIRGGWGQPQTPGGISSLTSALESAAKSAGAEIRTGARVQTILITDEKAQGVLLENGEEIRASQVVSSADPRQTFLQLVEPEHLDPEFTWQARNIKMRGVTARLHLLMDDLRNHPQGTHIIAPSLNTLERAYDAAKYGQISEKPYLQLTVSENTLSVHMQFAPYHLRGSGWDTAARALLEKRILETISESLPGFTSHIRASSLLTPLDLESTYALTEGDPHHGQIMLDQFLFMRPLPGWSNHKTPIEGLYLCGSGGHGGGGISGIPGRNAARQILKKVHPPILQ